MRITELILSENLNSFEALGILEASKTLITLWSNPTEHIYMFDWTTKEVWKQRNEKHKGKYRLIYENAKR